jgi:hypothetical protein
MEEQEELEVEVYFLLLEHRKLYFQDLLTPSDDEGKSSVFGDQLLKIIGISMTKDMGENWFKAIRILNDHVDGNLSTRTATQRLMKLI